MNYISAPGIQVEVIKENKANKCARIIDTVCELSGFTQEEVKKNRRFRPLVEVRYICFSMLLKYGGMCKSAIGKVFGKDHTSVIHGLKTLDDLIKTDNEFKDRVMFIESKIRN